jgi:phospholipid/cholesterol/gamma-HCH transport system substrate-binding protein
METKVNLALVGAFVLTLSLAIVAGVLWVSSGGTSRRAYDTYLAYSDESVSGLNRDAPVKYKGVVVGAVKEIGLDPKDPQRVRLVLAIEQGVPIKHDTFAVLTLQGLTGIAFLDLEGGSKEAPLLVATEPGEYPVIQTRPSLFRRLDTQATALVEDLTRTAQSVNRLLDEDTRASLQRTIMDMETVVHAFAGRSENIDAAVVAATQTMENSAKASEQLAELTRQIGRSADAVTRAAERTAVAAEAVRTTAANAESGAQQLRTETLPEVQRLLVEARMATAALSRLALELERNPNALVRGREPAPRGPGE